MTRQIRCHACYPPTEFTHDGELSAAVCPKCGTKADDPRAANLFVPLVLVHLEPPHATIKRPGVGNGELACRPGQPAADGVVRTGEAAAVTCPECKASDAFKAADGVSKIDPRYDVPLLDVSKTEGLVFGKPPAVRPTKKGDG